MKSLIKPVGLVILLGLLMLFGAQLLSTQETKPIKPTKPPRDQDTTETPKPVQQENYVSQVIISAPWAEKNLVYDGVESPPGEFGVYQYVVADSLKEQVDAGLPEGPTSFTVAPNGDIYITDPLNKRIQRFDANGNFVSVIPIPPLERIKYTQESDSARMERLRRVGKLPKSKEPYDLEVVPKITNGYQWYWKTICVDQDNNLYLRWDQPNEVSVRKYDQTGKLITTYPVFGPHEGPAGAGLYCDKSGRLFFQSYPLSFQLGTISQVFTAEQQEATLRRGVLGGNNLAEFKLYFKNLTTREFVQYGSSGNVIKRFPSTIGGGFIGADQDGNVYTSSAESDLNKKKMTWFIWKWDYRGDLISTVKWNTAIGESWGSGYWWGERKIIDQKGNLYIYYSTKDDLTVTKWSKQ